MKHENLHLSMAIFEKRIQLRDFAGSLISELSTSVQNCRYVFIFLKMKKIVRIFMEFFFCNFRPISAYAPVFVDQYQYVSSSGPSHASIAPGSSPTTGPDHYNNVMGLTGSGCASDINSPVTGNHNLYSATQYLNSSHLALGKFNMN